MNDISTAEAGGEFVVCGSCGARMKAGRRWCLRCDQELRPPKSQHFKLPAWLQSLGGGTLIFGTVGTLVVCVVAIMWWDSSSNQVDDVARPVAAPKLHSAPAPAVSAAPAPAAAAGSFEPLAASFELTGSGGADVAKGDLAVERTRLEEAVERNADDHGALNELGLVLERSGKLDEAVARFVHAIELSPDRPAYHSNLAHVLGRQNNWDAAANHYRLALGMLPADHAAQFNLAVALHRKGDDRAAVAEYEKAIQMAPAEATFHVALAASLERVGRLEDAQREFRKYLEMEPEGSEAARVKAHLDAASASPPTAQGGAPRS